MWRSAQEEANVVRSGRVMTGMESVLGQEDLSSVLKRICFMEKITIADLETFKITEDEIIVRFAPSEGRTRISTYPIVYLLPSRSSVQACVT